MSHAAAYSFPVIEVLRSRCPACGISITLPRSSSLGYYRYPEFEKSSEWPIWLLCDWLDPSDGHPQLRKWDDPDFKLEKIPSELTPEAQRASLWQVDCKCAHEGCENRHRIYMWYLATATLETITGFLSRAYPKLACAEDHLLDARQESTVVTRIEF